MIKNIVVSKKILLTEISKLYTKYSLFLFSILNLIKSFNLNRFFFVRWLSKSNIDVYW